MTYVSRAKEAIKQVARFNAPSPTNAQLAEMGQAALYHPTSQPIWNTILTQNSLVINPSNLTVLDDIGTLTGTATPPDFTPSSAGTIKSMIAVLFLRLTRNHWRNWLRSYRLLTANTAAVPLEEARDVILSTADTDAIPIIGDDTDDPES